ncbi:MAG: DUF4959 domain-containing protein [Tannerella sp.]|nr:DUF4959 domain-containing protein [Tannerella sp.]
MKNKLFSQFCILSIMNILVIMSCMEEDRLDQSDKHAPAPAPVTVSDVINKRGGAVIKYIVPKDKNLRGVRAVYERGGQKCQTEASLYLDSLTVEGYGNADHQEVKLYSIGFNEKLSDPVTVQISPLNPAVSLVNLDIDAGFGGVKVKLNNNVEKENLSLVLLADTLSNDISKDSRNWFTVQTFYTSGVSMTFVRTGMEAKTTNFALFARDRWNNKSDTLVRILTPIAEVKLPKTGWRDAALPGDLHDPAEGLAQYRLQSLWDGGESASVGQIYSSSSTTPMPQIATIDLARNMVISRMQMWPRVNEIYAGRAVRVFQLWGSLNPNPNGNLDDTWTFLGEWEVLKPSGYNADGSVGAVTAADREFFHGGMSFEIVPSEITPDPYMPIRYLRLIVVHTYDTYLTGAKNGQVFIREITLWGQLPD